MTNDSMHLVLWIATVLTDYFDPIRPHVNVFVLLQRIDYTRDSIFVQPRFMFLVDYNSGSCRL